MECRVYLIQMEVLLLFYNNVCLVGTARTTIIIVTKAATLIQTASTPKSNK